MGDMAGAALNLPIQMISLSDRTGRLTPMGFRFEDEEHQIMSVKVNRVISREKTNIAGIREVKVICGALFDGQERLMELRYNVESQQWRVYQFFS